MKKGEILIIDDNSAFLRTSSTERPMRSAATTRRLGASSGRLPKKMKRLDI